MSNNMFLFSLALLFTLFLVWSFRTLPGERWQILAAVPGERHEGHWHGTNLTWYGVLTAGACLAAVALFLVLLGALGVPTAGILTMAALLLSLCLPAAGLVARLVEGKAHTLTVGGAMFVGLLAAPAAVALANALPWSDPLRPLPLLPALAALAIAYAVGEGIGRTACISFGCCCGKPVAACSPRLQRVFSRWHFTFFGATRKIAYAGGLEGERVVPVQAITAILYLGTALAAAALYLQGLYGAAFLVALVVTQAWRVISEVLRADYRGAGRFSAYQWMALAAVPVGAALVAFSGETAGPGPEAIAGVRRLWHPAVLLFLQGLSLLVFWRTGRSMVTGAEMSFHVHRDRI